MTALAGEFDFANPQYALSFDRTQPALSELSVDPLGRGRFVKGNIQPMKPQGGFRLDAHGKSFEYLSEEGSNWTVSCGASTIQLSSRYRAGERAQPFILLFQQKQCHATLLGLMPDRQREVLLPCVLHLPGEGSLVIQSKSGKALGYDARRRGDQQPFVRVEFPPADLNHPEVAYRLQVKALYRNLPGISADPRFDGYKRDSITIFQLNPRVGVLANNASSDPVAFTLFEYADAAKYAPRLAPGLTCWDILRQTLERYMAGVKGYGQAGYGGNPSDADLVPWSAPYDSADSLPSLLIAACECASEPKSLRWGRTNYPAIKGWFDRIAAEATDSTGLIEFARTGNYDDRPVPSLRPANWWDCINFGYHDAYSNALAYRAALLFASLAERLRDREESEKAFKFAERLKKSYVHEFYNPESGLLAGWRSKDGALHDYAFPFVNGAAVVFGVVDRDLGNRLMDGILAKMKEVGFNRFDLGIPGNLVPIRKGDYTKHDWAGSKGVGEPELEDGSDAFQIYENGGATSSFAYFTVKALYELGLVKEAREIFYPMLESFRTGEFMGFGPNGQSKDWRDWQGRCHGYEGLLVDGFLPLVCVWDDWTAGR